MKKVLLSAAIVLLGVAMAGAAYAADTVVQMNLITEQGAGKAIGTVTLSDTPGGLQFAPMLSGLAPGTHGYHVHEKPDCGPAMKDGKAAAGFAAGGHYDPAKTGKHEGPLGKGHMGDLPALVVGPDGTANTPVIAPHLKLADVKGRSLMIHAGGDNYSDVPAALGGGGARVACGVIP